MRYLIISICFLFAAEVGAQFTNSASPPALFWSTYYGGTNIDHGINSASDTSNSTYVTGVTLSGNFPVSAGAFQVSYAGDSDLFILKFSPIGQRIWATYYGGTGSDHGRSISVDKNGNIIVTGLTSSPNFPVTAGAFQTSKAGGYDAFVVKFNSQGQRLWATYCGGTNNDVGHGISTDDSNNIYIAGFTSSLNFPVTTGSFQQNNAGGMDCFVIKFNSAGQRVWATYYGGTLDDDADAIAVDSRNNILLTGATLSTNFPAAPGAFQTFNAGNTDAFAVKLNRSGQRVWATYYGGTAYDFGFGGITSDASGNVFMGGRTSSPNFPVTQNAFQTNNAGNYDAYYVKLDSLGNRLYATFIGGFDPDFGEGIIIGLNNDIYISGYTNSLDFPVTGDAYQINNAGIWDAFVMKFNSSNLREYGTYFGSSQTDECYSVSSVPNGDIIITGRTDGNNFPYTNGAFQISNAGSGDAFISYFKANPIGLTPISSTVPDKFSLSQNYPNPFNPATKIRFQIPKSGFVNMAVYDVLGREIAALVNQNLHPGTYEADWDAANYPSGVYFYKLTAGDYTKTRKMILIK